MIKQADNNTKTKLQEMIDELLQEVSIDEDDEYYYDDYYDNVIYRLSYFLKKEDISMLYEIIIDGKTVDFLSTYDLLGIKVVSPFELSDKKEIYDEIKVFFKSNILIEACIDLRDNGFYETIDESSFSKEHIYNYKNYYVINKNETTLLRDAFEKRFPILGAVSFEVISGDKINEYLYDKNYEDYPMWKDKSNINNIAGFRYLTPEKYSNCKLLVAKTNNAIIGVIKWGKYYEGKSYAHYGLNYIDVAIPYRKNGIAKLLINELKNHIETDLPFILSRESEMGSKCHMEKNFKKVFGDAIYTSKEWEDYQYSLIK